MLAGVEEKDEKSEQDCLVEIEVDEGRDLEKLRSRCSKLGSERAGRRLDERGGDPTSNDVRDGADRLREEPE